MGTIAFKKGIKRGLVLMVAVLTIYYIIESRGNLSVMKQIALQTSKSKKLPPFQPEVTEDFPTLSEGEPRIPHILHQTYKSEQIPINFASNLESFLKWNPAWTYYLWTDDSARQLIQERHPYLLEIWDNYRKPINRADALRYVVLYEFGGVYADLDVEFLRPLDRVTMKYACIFPTEPFEHSAFRLGIPYLLSNAVMMCRPKHPFIAQMLQNLAKSVVFLEQIDVAGPAFVTYNFLVYNKIDDIYKVKSSNDSSSPYFYTGTLPEDHIDAVYIPNTVYFMDTLDEHLNSEQKYYQTCSQFVLLSDLIQRACRELYKRGFHRENHQYAFTVHQWYQSYNPEILEKYLPEIFGVSLVHISQIVPNYVIY
ncbi:hypothetical protein ACF0H5_007343 [Mactra antiquata]